MMMIKYDDDIEMFVTLERLYRALLIGTNVNTTPTHTVINITNTEPGKDPKRNKKPL
jgi:hypothetical protein